MVRHPLSRRAILRGAGAMIGLPFLEAMLPRRASAAGAPVRFVGWFHPNGYNQDVWTPSAEGANFPLSPTLKPLANVKDYLLVLTGLTIADGNVGSHDGGQRALLTASRNIAAGVTDSFDQIVARKYGSATKIGSLQLGLEINGLYEPFEDTNKDGLIDSPTQEFDDTKDYCDVSDCRLSVTKGSRLPNLYNPRLVFERIFGAGAMGGPKPVAGAAPAPVDKAAAMRRVALKRSVLDFVATDANTLKKRLGHADQVRLDEYLTGVRQIEKSITQAEMPLAGGCSPGAKPGGIPMDPMARLRLMADLTVRAFQCDATRAVTFQLGRGLSPMKFVVDGVSYPHHDASHWVGDMAKRKAKDVIDQTLIAQLAYFLEAMKKAGDSNGAPLLDNVVLYASSDIADPNKHDHVGMPVIVAGKGGGMLKTGRHLRAGMEGRQTGDLFLALLPAFGIQQDKFGEFGTKALGGLT